MELKPRVEEYMTRNVSTVSPDDLVAEVTQLIRESDGHNGFPVCSERMVEGFVTARDLLGADDTATVRTVMTEDILVADPDMSVTDAARVILRSGIQKLPVIDAAGELIGIISNTDVIRSQIERATPEKVGKLTRTLTDLHGVTLTQARQKVRLSELIPTQTRVYADELEGRRYELERGLAEPLVVIDDAGESGSGELYLADGHHRVLAAEQLGITEMEAYIILPEQPIELGIAQTAEKNNLTSMSDVSVVDYARHPLVETTERLQ